MKKTAVYIILAGCLILLAGCSAAKGSREKLRDIEFTVVAPADAPKELLDEISGRKEDGFALTFADEGYLYAAKGYGAQETSGYSVEVKQCFETEDAVRVETELLGPPKDEETAARETYPQVIIKMEYTDKDVMFE